VIALAWWVYLGSLAALAVFGAHRLWLVALAWRRRGAQPSPVAADEQPIVTVQLPLFDEPAVAARLLDAVGALDWPRDRLEIQILDDSRDATTAICAAAAERLRGGGPTSCTCGGRRATAGRRARSRRGARSRAARSCSCSTPTSCRRRRSCARPSGTSRIRASRWCRCAGST
jgi:cellulose synthase/poly-beta-1,6-N-acetylglucosamine synthase-like glycosyltransferase